MHDLVMSLGHRLWVCRSLCTKLLHQRRGFFAGCPSGKLSVHFQMRRRVCSRLPHSEVGDDAACLRIFNHLCHLRCEDRVVSDLGPVLLLYVSLFGSAASYGVFFYLATVKGSLTRLSSLTFLTPMFAAASGYFLLGETLTPIQLAGAFVTLIGVTALNISPGSDDRPDGDPGKDA